MKHPYSITKKTNITILAVFLWVFFLPFNALAQHKILNIRHWAAPDHTRVVIDTSEDIPYAVEEEERKISFTFKGTKYFKNLPHEMVLKKTGIDKILVTSLPDDGLTVELFITDDAESNIFKLKKFEEKPDRVVIDLVFPEVEKQETQEREQVKVTRKNKIIVIDPGHGGEDPGAVGKRGTYEKKVVLEISRQLKRIINKKEGYRAFLTRDGDYYVPFKKRLKIAREYGADLFISIHADAFKRRDARGSSVYCLSIGGASSEAAKYLARRENLADLVGGSPNGESNDESDPIILNMFQTNTINTSKIFGSNLLKHLNDIGHVKFNRVQEAPFRVLKLPEIPSVLVETAYISNPNEERLLRTSRHQMVIAKAVASAVYDFLPLEPAPIIVKREATTEKELNKSTEITVPSVTEKEVVKKTRKVVDEPEQASKPRLSFYRVEKGDTLEKIAIRNNTTINALSKLNHMKLNDPLYVGRKLKIAETEGDSVAAPDKPKKKAVDDKVMPDAPPPVSIYKVKRGDTLEKIAIRNDTTISALLKLNRMRLNDPLYVGRKLKIAETERDSVAVPDKPKKKKTASPPAIISYKVKRGDTLDKIAKKYNTSVDELRKLNKMKRTDTLYVDQKLKLPQNPT
jgi:N-acetylmuramoyl-L-alanine amidase